MSLHASRLASPEEVRALLASVSASSRPPDRRVSSTRRHSERLERLSAALVGRPYLAFSLVGGPEEAEELVSRIDAFDCVTFVETTLALAASRRPEEFPKRLARLRYLGGRVRWADRNHYWSSWIRRNTRAGHVEPVLPTAWVWGADRPRELDVVQGYPTHYWRPRWLPVPDALPLLAAHAAPGDVVGFVSRKPNLDTFHVGLLIPGPAGEPLRVRHAGRAAGKVVDQDLAAFCDEHDVPGLLVVRPLDPFASPRPRSSA